MRFGPLWNGLAGGKRSVMGQTVRSRETDRMLAMIGEGFITDQAGLGLARLAALRISGLDRRISTFASIGSALAHLTPGLSARTGPLPPCDKGGRCRPAVRRRD